MLSFSKMQLLAEAQQIVLVFTNPLIENPLPGQDNAVSEFCAQIESGQVTAHLEFSDSNPVRLGTMGGGHVVGEIGFYLNQPRTAAVVTDVPSTLLSLIKADPETDGSERS